MPKKPDSVLVGRVTHDDDRPPLRIDFVGASAIENLGHMKDVVDKHLTASAAVYIKGAPADVASAVAHLATRRFKQVNATVSMRGAKTKKRS